MILSDGRRFTIVGGGIDAGRTVRRSGDRVAEGPDGRASLVFSGPDGIRRLFPIPVEVRETRDFADGHVRHVAAAILAGMSDGRDTGAGAGYLAWLVERQVAARADFLDLHVDGISLESADRETTMAWLVRTLGELTHAPLSLDSASVDTMRAGMAALVPGALPPMLNSAAPDRLEVLDLAAEAGCSVVLSAAGASGRSLDADERAANALRMVDAAAARGIPLGRMYVDAVVLPVATATGASPGAHFLAASRRLRAELGPEIRITGGLSNASAGLPERRLLDDVFLDLALDAGVDSGIIDPIATDPDRVLALDRLSRPYRLAAAALTGADPACAAWLSAHRAGELAAGAGA